MVNYVVVSGNNDDPYNFQRILVWSTAAQILFFFLHIVFFFFFFCVCESFLILTSAYAIFRFFFFFFFFFFFLVKGFFVCFFKEYKTKKNYVEQFQAPVFAKPLQFRLSAEHTHTHTPIFLRTSYLPADLGW